MDDYLKDHSGVDMGAIQSAINIVKITPFCINFNFHTDYFHWMLDHKEALENINNTGWWRSQKNEEERNMPRHPNRTPDWIPTRLTKIRRTLIDTQLEYLFGEGGYLKSDNWVTPEGHKCMRCNVSIDKLEAYLKGIIKLTDREKQRITGNQSSYPFSADEWEHILAEAIKRVNTHWDPLTIAKSKAILPTSRSRTLTYEQHGFCIDCWENAIKRQLGYTMED